MQALLKEVKFIGTSKISDFEVLRVLGRGSNGVVVEAKCIDPQFPFPEKRYAIKMCLNYDKNTSEVSNMFVNEFRLLARLDPHPNVIPYLEHVLGDMVAVPPDGFFNALTEVEQSLAVCTRRGRTRRRKTQFVFFPCISMDSGTRQ